MRLARILWPVIFLVPLVPLAGKLCSFVPTDFVYHSLVRVHERLPSLALAAAIVATMAALIRYSNVRARIQTLMTLSGKTPPDLLAVFADEARRLNIPLPSLAYIQVPSRFCFTAAGGPTVLISSGFADPLTVDQLCFVAQHELIHVRRRDPVRSLLWHLFFSALLLPGFEGLERWLYERRERKTDAVASKSDVDRYTQLVKQCSPHGHPEPTPSREFIRSAASPLQHSTAYVPVRPTRVAIRHLVPSGAALALIAGLIASHEAFNNHLPYLLTHHC